MRTIKIHPFSTNGYDTDWVPAAQSSEFTIREKLDRIFCVDPPISSCTSAANPGIERPRAQRREKETKFGL